MKEFNRDKHIQLYNQLNWSNNYNLNQAHLKCALLDLNAINLDLDIPIYRIFPLDRFVTTLTKKTLCLVRPKLWDDPFENFLLNSEGEMKDGTHVGFDSIREKLYGQCWSLKEECDGLWRNYTHPSCQKCTQEAWNNRRTTSPVSVKVKTTVGKLFDALYDMGVETVHSISYYIGKVEYVSDNELAQYISDGFNHITDTTGLGIVYSLLVKRKAFEYEQEVRLIFMQPSDNSASYPKAKNYWDASSDLFSVSIDPNSIFDEIVIDPWVTDIEERQIEHQIQSNGYTGKITRSSLYDTPFFKVII